MIFTLCLDVDIQDLGIALAPMHNIPRHWYCAAMPHFVFGCSCIGHLEFKGRSNAKFCLDAHSVELDIVKCMNNIIIACTSLVMKSDHHAIYLRLCIIIQ